LEDCAEELASHWQLSIGQESKEFIVCRGYQRDIDVPCHWQQRYTFKTLGHHIDDDAGIAGCFQHTTAAMIRSFYGNLNNGLRRASARAKYRVLRSSMQTVAEFRWARWPYQSQYAKNLDKLQLKMLATLFQITPKPRELYDAFVQRRHVQSGHLASQCGRWNRSWASSVTSWHQHRLRRHDAGTWGPALLNWHGQDWLSLQRVTNSGVNESRTRTRACRMKVHKRWEESLEHARQISF